MAIHFKFKSAKDYDTVTFPGHVIKLIDLKKAIVEKKKLSRGLDFDLVITDAQNGTVYEDDDQQLSKNTSVTVKRVPSRGGGGLLSRINARTVATTPQTIIPTPNVAVSIPKLTVAQVPSPNLEPVKNGGSAENVTSATSTAATSATTTSSMTATETTCTSEETSTTTSLADEMAALQSINIQAEGIRGPSHFGNKSWTSSTGSNADKVTNYYSSGPGMGRGNPYSGRGGGGGRGGMMMSSSNGPHLRGPAAPLAGVTGAPPANYVCYRCGTPGHYIQNCPTNGDPEFDQHRVKKKTGIPKTFMKAVSDPSSIQVGDGKTVVNAPWGGLAVIEPQSQNFSKLLARSGGSSTVEQLRMNPPKHIACPICKNLLKDAVLIPCCQESACDECLRAALIDNKMICPLCKTTGMFPDKLLPNKVLRTSVDEFLRIARNEQKERARIEKETEEKLLAKQKKEAQASVFQPTKETADAILEIKKGTAALGGGGSGSGGGGGVLPLSADEDAFGGDVFDQEEEEDDTSSVVVVDEKPSSSHANASASAPIPTTNNMEEETSLSSSSHFVSLDKNHHHHHPELSTMSTSTTTVSSDHVVEGEQDDVVKEKSQVQTQDEDQDQDQDQEDNESNPLMTSGGGPVGNLMMGRSNRPMLGGNTMGPWDSQMRGPPPSMMWNGAGPWMDGPPPHGHPGWYDGPPPWMEGHFGHDGMRGRGSRRGSRAGGGGGGGGKGGRNSGRGGDMPPPRGFYGPPPDYFGPRDYYGPPPSWFDGPMLPYPPGPWFDGGHSSRGRRRKRSDDGVDYYKSRDSSSDGDDSEKYMHNKNHYNKVGGASGNSTNTNEDREAADENTNENENENDNKKKKKKKKKKKWIVVVVLVED